MDAARDVGMARGVPPRWREPGHDDEFTLKTRSAISFATHQLGQAREALRLLAELPPDQERALNQGHADTLETRGQVAG